MNDVTTQHARPAVRASDAEREQAVALLRSSFADGRLTLPELEERAGAAYAARTRAQLGEIGMFSGLTSRFRAVAELWPSAATRDV
jgi:hypothetical protein